MKIVPSRTLQLEMRCYRTTVCKCSTAASPCARDGSSHYATRARDSSADAAGASRAHTFASLPHSVDGIPFSIQCLSSSLAALVISA